MEKYYGNYLGLVINNQDPEGRDRVQIYVPGVTNTLYDNWNNNNTNKSIGMDIGSTFTLNEQILKKLKSVLPWAEKATPLIGPGCSVYQQSEGGSSSLPFDNQTSNSSKSSSPNVNTSNGDRPDIDGYKMNELSDKMYEITLGLKNRFGDKVKLESAKRKVITKNGETYVVGNDGITRVNSSLTSRHNDGDAIDISDNGLSEEDKKAIFIHAVEIGGGDVNEIIEHDTGSGNHLHIGMDPKKTEIYGGKNTQSYIRQIISDVKSGEISTGKEIPIPLLKIKPATAANSESATQKYEPTVITTKPAEPSISDYPDSPKSIVGAGTPEGNRSTTRPLCRVWLFFYGGDVQKPVFFAYSLPPNETYAHNSVSAPNQTDSNSEVYVIDFESDNPEITTSTKSSDGSEIINGKTLEVPLPE